MLAPWHTKRNGELELWREPAYSASSAIVVASCVCAVACEGAFSPLSTIRCPPLCSSLHSQVLIRALVFPFGGRCHCFAHANSYAVSNDTMDTELRHRDRRDSMMHTGPTPSSQGAGLNFSFRLIQSFMPSFEALQPSSSPEPTERLRHIHTQSSKQAVSVSFIIGLSEIFIGADERARKREQRENHFRLLSGQQSE